MAIMIHAGFRLSQYCGLKAMAACGQLKSASERMRKSERQALEAEA